jgi:hypothetical protein
MERRERDDTRPVSRGWPTGLHREAQRPHKGGQIVTNHGRMIGLGCALILATTGGAYAQDRDLTAELVGGIIDLDTGETSNMGGVSAAYNTTDNEYRVFWFDSRIEGQNDVYAQRVAPNGTLLGDNVTIICGESSQTDTAAAYDPVNNRYFVTWKNQSDGPGSPGFNHSYGALVAPPGTMMGREFDVSNAGLEATLAFNTTSNEYFLEARNFAGGGSAGIYGRRISAEGDLVGGSITISTSGAPAPAGQVAYNPNGNQYLATWRDQSNENLKGRIINADGSFATAAFTISAMFPESGLAASVAFDPGHDRYLVVFSEFCAGGVYGQFVSSAGTLDGPTFTIAESTARLAPFVAWDRVNSVFLVAWTDSDTGDLAVQLVHDDGGLAGDWLAIPNPGWAYGPPRVVTNSTEGGFLVAWTDHIWDPPAQHDVLAQLIGVASEAPCPGDLDGDNDVDLDDLLILLAHYGTTSGATYEDGDIDGDEDVDLNDLTLLLQVYGTVCE